MAFLRCLQLFYFLPFPFTSVCLHLFIPAQDRREMLEEIMRRGTSALGTDVPSEREINRLAARSEEEFWLFEKMDEERRQKEKYRSRLMEEHEVPEWVYSVPEGNEEKNKASEIFGIAGKRKRKEVIYADTLSDLQWMKAVENGEIPSLSMKGNRRETPSREGSASTSNVTSTRAEDKLIEFDDNMPVMSEGTSEDNSGLEGTPKRQKCEGVSSRKHEFLAESGSEWSRCVITWKTHKKKRSSYVQGSSDSRHNSNGRGNGWA